MTQFIQISTTTATEEEAQRIARGLVASRLVACAHVYPMKSIYQWHGKLEEDNEWHCQLKTRQSLFDRVATEIRKLHTYDCPQIIAVPIVEGGAEYLTWMDEGLESSHLPVLEE